MDGLRAEEGDGLEQKPGMPLAAKPDKALSLTEPFLRTAEPSWGEGCTPQATGAGRTQCSERKLSIRLSAFFDETEGMRRRPCQGSSGLAEGTKNVILRSGERGQRA